MEKSKVYKIIISLGLLILAILPIIDEELYVSSTGKMEHPDLFFVLIVIIGLFKKWKHLKGIVLIIMTIGFFGTLLWVAMSVFNKGIMDIRIGFCLNTVILAIMIMYMLKLRKIEK